MKVALIQMEIAEKNTPGNIVHGLDLLQEAAATATLPYCLKFGPQGIL